MKLIGANSVDRCAEERHMPLHWPNQLGESLEEGQALECTRMHAKDNSTEIRSCVKV